MRFSLFLSILFTPLVAQGDLIIYGDETEFRVNTTADQTVILKDVTPTSGHSNPLEHVSVVSHPGLYQYASTTGLDDEVVYREYVAQDASIVSITLHNISKTVQTSWQYDNISASNATVPSPEVPEPSALVLNGTVLAFAAFLFIRNRRKKGSPKTIS